MTVVTPAAPPPGTHFVANAGAQADFIASLAPEKLISSMWGRGKTRSLCEDLDLTARAFPGAELVITRKYREDMGNTTLQCLLNEVITPEHRDRYWKRSADGGSQLEYPNGSVIHAVGLDRSSKLRSGAFLKIMVDEAQETEEREWIDAAGRLRQWRDEWRWYDWKRKRWMQPVQQIGGACNPDSPAHWLYTHFRLDNPKPHKLYTKEETRLANGHVVPPGELIGEVFYNDRSDNVAHLPLSYLKRLARLRGTYFDRYELGRWVAHKGLVYPHFTRDLHVRRRPSTWSVFGGNPPPEWPRVVAIDFGYENPFVCLWLARDPRTGCWWMYREIYHSQRLVNDHARKIVDCERAELEALREGVIQSSRDTQEVKLRIADLREYPCIGRFADHDREDRETLHAYGDRHHWDLSTEPAYKDVASGIQCVYEQLLGAGQMTRKSDTIEPGLVLIDDALVELDDTLEHDSRPTCTADEFVRYSYPDKRDGKTPSEDPKKIDDHGMDAIRYGLKSIHMRGEL